MGMGVIGMVISLYYSNLYPILKWSNLTPIYLSKFIGSTMVINHIDHIDHLSSWIIMWGFDESNQIISDNYG